MKTANFVLKNVVIENGQIGIKVIRDFETKDEALNWFIEHPDWINSLWILEDHKGKINYNFLNSLIS